MSAGPGTPPPMLMPMPPPGRLLPAKVDDCTVNSGNCPNTAPPKVKSVPASLSRKELRVMLAAPPSDSTLSAPPGPSVATFPRKVLSSMTRSPATPPIHAAPALAPDVFPTKAELRIVTSPPTPSSLSAPPSAPASKPTLTFPSNTQSSKRKLPSVWNVYRAAPPMMEVWLLTTTSRKVTSSVLRSA